MEPTNIYETDNSYVDFSIYLPAASQDLEDPLFRFRAT